MRLGISFSVPMSLVLVAPLIGCSPPVTSGADTKESQASERRSGDTRSASPSPKNVGRISGPAVPRDVKDQKNWESRNNSLHNAWRTAHASGNQLAAKRRKEEFETFRNAAWKDGTVLEGWIGVVTDIDETYVKYPDKKGKTALTATVWLSDKAGRNAIAGATVNGDVPWLRIVNYDLQARRSTGLEEEFEGLKNGQVVRIWGKMQTQPRAEGDSELAVTRLELVDFTRERAKLLATVKSMQADAAGLGDDQNELLREVVTGRRDWPANTPHLIYCSRLAATYPEYKKALQSFNAFQPFDVSRYDANCRKWTSMLENVRFLDENELRQIESAHSALQKAIEAAEAQQKNRRVIVDKIEEGKRDLEKLQPPLNDDPEWTKYLWVPKTYRYDPLQ